MIMINYDIGVTFELKPGIINAITIEPPDLIDSIAVSLSQQIAGIPQQSIDFLENEAEINLSKRCELICSPIDMEYNKREIQKKLLSEMCEEAALYGYDDSIAEANGKIMEYISELKLKSDYNIDFDELRGMSDLLKYFDVHIENPKGNFCERFIEYATTIRKLIGKDIFILVNCDAFISDTDYDHLLDWAKYEDINFLIIENKQLELKQDINSYIIDKDLCEIH